jgi:hypothetical protein
MKGEVAADRFHQCMLAINGDVSFRQVSLRKRLSRVRDSFVSLPGSINKITD